MEYVAGVEAGQRSVAGTGAAELAAELTERSDQPIGWITETDIAAAMSEGRDLNEIRIRDLIASAHT